MNGLLNFVVVYIIIKHRHQTPKFDPIFSQVPVHYCQYLTIQTTFFLRRTPKAKTSK